MLDSPWQSGRLGNVSWLLFSFLTHSVFHGDEGPSTAFISLSHVFEIVHPWLPSSSMAFTHIFFLNAFFPTWIQCKLFQCKCWGKCPSTLPFFCRFVSLCLSNHIIGLRHDAVFSSLHHGYLFPAVCSPVWCFSRCMQYIFELFICLVGSRHSCPVGLAPLPSQHALLHLDGSL